MLATSVAEALTKHRPKEDGARDKEFGKSFSDKQFQRVSKLSGGEMAWNDWSFDFRTAAQIVNPKIGEVLEAAEKWTVEKTAEELEKEDGVKYHDLVLRSKELYGVLVLLTENEAKKVVKGALVEEDLVDDAFARSWEWEASTFVRVGRARK